MLDAADSLIAQERIEAVMDAAVGSGNLKKGPSQNHVRRLQKAADKHRAKSSEQKAPATSVADLKAFGIKVVAAPKKAESA